jgi:hypothetical protein
MPHIINADLAIDPGCLLGEGPSWDVRAATLLTSRAAVFIAGTLPATSFGPGRSTNTSAWPYLGPMKACSSVWPTASG